MACDCGLDNVRQTACDAALARAQRLLDLDTTPAVTSREVLIRGYSGNIIYLYDGDDPDTGEETANWSLNGGGNEDYLEDLAAAGRVSASEGTNPAYQSVRIDISGGDVPTQTPSRFDKNQVVAAALRFLLAPLFLWFRQSLEGAVHLLGRVTLSRSLVLRLRVLQ